MTSRKPSYTGTSNYIVPTGKDHSELTDDEYALCFMTVFPTEQYADYYKYVADKTYRTNKSPISHDRWNELLLVKLITSQTS